MATRMSLLYIRWKSNLISIDANKLSDNTYRRALEIGVKYLYASKGYQPQKAEIEKAIVKPKTKRRR